MVLEDEGKLKEDKIKLKKTNGASLPPRPFARTLHFIFPTPVFFFLSLSLSFFLSFLLSFLNEGKFQP
jgi:hypothetical protein